MDVVTLEIEKLKFTAAMHIEGKQYGKAIKLAKKILLMEAGSLTGKYLLSLCYLRLGKDDLAVTEAKDILAVDSGHIEARMILVYVYKRQYKVAEEISILYAVTRILEQKGAAEKELTIKESHLLAESYSLLGSAYTFLGDIKSARRFFLLSSEAELDESQKIIEYSNYLFASNYDVAISNQEMFRQHLAYNQFFAAAPQFSHKKRKETSKIKIGYISPDFRQHAVAFFIYSLLADFNRERFYVTCYFCGQADETTERLRRLADCWRDIHLLAADEAAQLIYDDQIDILVDLSGHTANNALPVLARKPAPVQISGIGYFNTTGLRTVDYFLTDVYCDPYGCNDAYFCEKLLRLPHSHFCYSAGVSMPDCADAPCAKNGYLTFGCFNNFSKVSDETLAMWRKILAGVPKAKLVLKSKIFGSEFGRQLVLRRLATFGIEEDRLDLRPFSADYLTQYHDIDIALDTYPYPGGATTCETLYMGVPVITLAGLRHGSRFGLSLLKNAGLEDLVALDPTEYVEKAVALAMDWELLQALHRNLRAVLSQSALMDSKRYVADIEYSYEKIWRERQESGLDSDKQKESNFCGVLE